MCTATTEFKQYWSCHLHQQQVVDLRLNIQAVLRYDHTDPLDLSLDGPPVAGNEQKKNITKKNKKSTYKLCTFIIYIY